jgi:hypothetical protein
MFCSEDNDGVLAKITLVAYMLEQGTFILTA